jgi:hypothetical protein
MPASIITATTGQYGGGSSYTSLPTDSLILVNTASIGTSSTVTLSNPTTVPYRVTVKDSAGAASTYPITINTLGGGAAIDGGSSASIKLNYGSIDLVWNGSGWSDANVTSLVPVQVNGTPFAAEPAISFSSDFNLVDNFGSNISVSPLNNVNAISAPYQALNSDRFIIVANGAVTLPTSPFIGQKITIFVTNQNSASYAQTQTWAATSGSAIILGGSGVTYSGFYPVAGTINTSFVLKPTVSTTFTFVGNIPNAGAPTWVSDQQEDTSAIATSASDYTNIATDSVIACDTTSGPVTVYATTTPNYLGKRLVIVDFLGNAATNNITVQAISLISGYITYTINQNYGRVDLVYTWTPGGSGGATWR